MGFYIRKSLRAGPLRFNLSKSGIGVSAGITGFRVGTGPRGNYVHVGRNGLYYRTTLPSGTHSPESQNSSRISPRSNQSSTVDMREIESANILDLKDSTSSDLLSEMNDKQQKMIVWPFATMLSTFLLIFLIALKAPVWSMLITIPVAGIVIFLIHRHDQLSKTTILFYDLDEEAEKAYQALHNAIQDLALCEKSWHISSSGQITSLLEWKRQSGASQLVSRNPIKYSFLAPPYVSTNLSIPTIPVGKLFLYFFPDCLFVYQDKQFGAVSYSDLKVELGNKRFIENESLPTDAKTVDTTWRYVNKSGGPDRRFKDNRQLPIVLYSELLFKSNSGLNGLLQLSKPDMGKNLLEAIEKIVATQL
ncbi:MAG: DUF4236 domain-containing protein [Pelolinea sp.]|nr:DUF4236 domain-containing protein [Pelolinea sp.]